MAFRELVAAVKQCASVPVVALSPEQRRGLATIKGVTQVEGAWVGVIACVRGAMAHSASAVVVLGAWIAVVAGPLKRCVLASVTREAGVDGADIVVVAGVIDACAQPLDTGVVQRARLLVVAGRLIGREGAALQD